MKYPQITNRHMEHKINFLKGNKNFIQIITIERPVIAYMYMYRMSTQRIVACLVYHINCYKK